jgi:rare lipoprotein A
MFALAGFGLVGLAVPAEASSARRHPHPRSSDLHRSAAQRPAGQAAGDTAASGAIVGIASFYGAGESSRTASGERFNPRALTAAHRTLPLGTNVRVTNLSNSRQVVVRINDRGPFSHGRVIDLSRSAAEALDFVSRGVTRVRIETV